MASSLGLATALKVALGKSLTSLNFGSMMTVQLMLRLQPLWGQAELGLSLCSDLCKPCDLSHLPCPLWLQIHHM